jgi:hypothetical protein
MDHNEVVAAIAMALHQYRSTEVHDVESYRLTIAPRRSEWNSRAAAMRQKPQKR